jgi:methionyl-tRNA formyltransferase
LDTGDIVYQEPFSLEGELSDIFTRITTSGIVACSGLIRTLYSTGTLPVIPQNEADATHYRRRTSEQSEIKPEDFSLYTATELHNKIRALQDPYPNPFITCKDGTKLYVKLSAV